MRTPLQPTPPIGARAATPTSMAAPIKGWNAREGKANMGPLWAYDLINWFPETADIKIRSGCADWKTSFPLLPTSLLPYASTTTQKLFASTSANIYDVTSSGAVGAAVTSCTNGVWQSVNFNTVGGAYLQAVNGVDKLKLYDGTTWTNIDAVSVPAITGLATTSISNICVFKRRIWYVQKNSMSLWYLPSNSISGALTEFAVGQLFSRGGYVVAATNWTIDGGSGVDDHFIIITSEGEVAVYKGTDPASATTFALQGVYFVGKPLGAKCFAKLGGDVLILTETGLVAFSKVFAGQSNAINTALSSNIDGAFAQAVRLYKDQGEWTCNVFPAQNALIVNIPTLNNLYAIQFVMNTITGAWAQFNGWDAVAMTVFNAELYFTTPSKVVKAWTGVSDYGANIAAIARQSYNYFGSRGVLKQFKLIKPILEFDYNITLELGLDVDFEDRNDYNAISIARSTGYLWDSGLWDTAVWSSDSVIESNWRTVDAKIGYALSLRMRISTNTAQVKWTATDIIFEKGGIF